MYLHKELETLTRPEIEKLQLERLQKTVRHCMNSPFYKQRFAENHLSPEDIRSLDDLQKIPFTTKQDLRDTYPFGLASVPLEKTVRLHSSSGTTGNPTVILHTQKDLDEWANAVARCLYMVGLRPGDIFQNSSGYGMFTGGLGFQYGAERLGYFTTAANPPLNGLLSPEPNNPSITRCSGVSVGGTNWVLISWKVTSSIISTSSLLV